MRKEFLLFLLLIFLTGFATRIYLAKFTYIFGFDSYYFARMAGYIVQHGSIPEEDPLMYRGFEDARRMFMWPWAVSMYLPAWVYLIFFGNNLEIDKLLLVFKYLPAVIGGIGSVVVAFLVLPISGPFAAVLAGFFAATNPAYIYRTMSGFYEDDALGYMLIALTVALGFKTYEETGRKRYIYGALTALSCYLAAMSWKAFPVFEAVFIIFLGLSFTFNIFEYLRKKITIRLPDYVWAGISAVFALIYAYILKTMASSAAGLAYVKVGAITETVLFMLAAPLLSVPLFAASSFYLFKALEKNSKKELAYAFGLFVVALIPYIALSASGSEIRFTTPDGLEMAFNIPPGTGLGALFFGSALIVIGAQFIGAFVAHFSRNPEKNIRKDALLVSIFLIALFVAFLSAFTYGKNWAGPLLGLAEGKVAQVHSIGAKYHFLSIIEPKLAGVITNTVGEETFGFMNWPAKYGLLTVFIFFAVPVFIYKRKDPRVLFLLAWFLLAVYTAWIKLKFTYYLGIPIAFASALVIHEVYARIKDKRAFYLALYFLLFAMISTALYHTVTRVPTLLTPEEALEMAPLGGKSAEAYFELFDFLKTTPPDSNILNWWNIGHWITFFTNRGVTTDNTNIYMPADRYIAQFYLSPEEKAYEMAKEIHSDYVVFETQYFFTAPNFYTYAVNKVDYRDENRYRYSVFVFPCSEVNTSFGEKIICTSRGRIFKIFDLNEWTNMPLLGGPGEKILEMQGVKYYMYRSGQRLFLIGDLLRNSVLYSFYTDTAEHFEKVWQSKDGKIKVFKVL